MRIEPNKHVKVLSPYTVSESGKLSAHDKEKFVKLDWNESTYPPSPLVLKTLAEFIEKKGGLNYYPDVTAVELRGKLSEHLGVPASRIQVFNGSDAALRDICYAYLNEDDSVLVREPVYTQIYTFIQSRGAVIRAIVGHDPFDKALDRYLDSLKADDVSMVYLPNPNNPTGLLYRVKEIDNMLRAFEETLFVIDEAYSEFAGVSAMELVERYANLIITRTFSKAFGLAGIRLGYIVCQEEVHEYINRVRNGKEVNTLAQMAAIGALEDIDYMLRKVEEVRANRDWLVEQLQRYGYEVHNTPANFILVRTGNVQALIEGLRSRKILVRDRSYLPQMDGFVRVSIGMRDEMQHLCAAMRDLKEARGRNG